MNKTIFTLLVVIMTCNISNAQISYGINSGLNISSTSSSLFSDYYYPNPDNEDISTGSYSESGVNIGAYFKYQFGDILGAKLELSYSNKGEFLQTQYKITEPSTAFRVINKLNYIEIPLSIYLGKKSGFSFDLGIAPSFFIGGKTSSGLLTSNDQFEFVGEMTESDFDNSIYNKTDIGLVAQIGYEFEFGLNINARIIKGLRDLYIVPTERYFKIHVLQFNLGYTMNKK